MGEGRPRITLAFSTFRPETLALAELAMRGHAAVCLQEPVTPGFAEMLTGELAVDEYLLLTEFQFPTFARGACRLLQGLHREGVVLLQVDPFLDQLIAIHELFASGGAPADIPPETTAARVYAAEKSWTAALLEFYQASAKGVFDPLVAAVVAFSRQDAAKIALQDAMRAQRLAELAQEYASLYVEAGFIHYSLLGALRRAAAQARIRSLHLLEPVTRPLYGRRQAYIPGDVLTFLLLSRPQEAGPRLELLAARSLVYSKIIAKEELTAGPFPHTADEMACGDLVRTLSYEACGQLYRSIRRLPTAEAKAAVRGRMQ